MLVGPGGPTGILGRPRNPYYPGGYPGGVGYPHFGGPQYGGFEGQHNGLGGGFGGGSFNPAFSGGGGGGGGGFGPHIDPYQNSYNQQFGGGPYGPYGPYYDDQGKNSAVKNKVEKKSAN